jgi:pyruvate dehydrogenase E2 component (dihydrolipoamide acetyltransferase)
MKREGQWVVKGEVLLMVETDKISLEVESPADGILQGIRVKDDEIVPVTSIIAYLLQQGETEADIPAPEPAKAASIPGRSDKQGRTSSPPATPLAMRMAETEGIDLEQLIGTGRHGEITRKDVTAGLERRQTGGGKVRATPAARRAARSAGIILEDLHGSGPRDRIQMADVRAGTGGEEVSRGDRIPIEGMRRKIAERMRVSNQEIPHIYLTITVDMTSFEAFRIRESEPRKARVSVTPLLTQLTARVLRNHPFLNSTFEKDAILLHRDVNIGMAVALEDGLIVPVIKNADKKSLVEIFEQMRELIDKARLNTLTLADVSGATFTISNLGSFGIEEFTALISPGQAGILAVGAILQQPAVIGQEISIRPMMKMTLGVDHRVVDGAQAARFMKDLKTALENPAVDEPGR